tara:strand:- start:1002 stop:2174 length:1173 start_codon:yes stop_codon:yes gene_type:complete
VINDELITSLSWVYGGAAVISTIALLSGQSMIIGYILLGIIFGPFGIALVTDPEIALQVGHVGMIFLLFLAGLHLDPKNLLEMLKKAVFVTITTSVVFVVVVFALLVSLGGFTMTECVVLALSMMFSSTLLGLKLLPSDRLHSHPVGETIISVLLIQDLLAILLMVVFNVVGKGSSSYEDIFKLVFSIPLLLGGAFFVERFVLTRLFGIFESVREYLFILAVGWCLLMSEFAAILDLSREIGAFVAGVSIASGSVSVYLAECLSPLRDFFLVLFFFSIGAGLDFDTVVSLSIPTIILAVTLMIMKPLMYWFVLNLEKDTDQGHNWEAGVRLGQASEFSILVSQVASQSKLLTGAALGLINATTVLTFILSSYWVARSFITPNMRINHDDD